MCSGAADDGWTAAMQRGDSATARAIERAVLAARDPATRDDPALPYHLRWVWDGSPVDGRHVLVRCYHGLGDTIQFARFLPALHARAACVKVEAPPAILPLLALLPGHDRLLPFDTAAPAKRDDMDLEIMELPHALDSDVPDIANFISGLAHINRSASWSRLSRPSTPFVALTRGRRGSSAFAEDDGGCKESSPPSVGLTRPTGVASATESIGLCWQAGDWDPMRSVPLGCLLAACHGAGHHFISLQRGPAAAQATDPRFINPVDEDCDILRTVDLILVARCVVTVDTMVAHLAGTFGRPTALLLRRHADWRWGTGDETPWYPSMRLYRQTQDGDWADPLRRLALSLAED